MKVKYQKPCLCIGLFFNQCIPGGDVDPGCVNGANDSLGCIIGSRD